MGGDQDSVCFDASPSVRIVGDEMGGAMLEPRYAETYSKMSEDELAQLATNKNLLTDPARIALEQEIQARGMQSSPPTVGKGEIVEEPKRQKAKTSRWARLGIFLGVALLSAIVASTVFVKGDSTTIESLTSASLKLGLAAWAISEAVAGQWLTLRRTLVAAIVLYGIAFVSMAVVLGKPLSTKLAEINEEQRQLDARFAETATGKTLLQPQSFVSPQVAATSLAEFERYANATEGLNDRKEALLQRDPSSRDAMAPYFGATRVVASTTLELYRFAAEPSRQVHVENGVVIIADPDGYNKRMDAVNDAIHKLKLATSAMAGALPKENQ
jgi:hypothetical protein